MNETREVYLGRIRRLQEVLEEQNIDAALLFDRENLNYYTGIEQTECMGVVIPRKGPAIGSTLSLDVAYTRTACALDDIRGYRFPKESLQGSLIGIMDELGLKKPRIGFERYFVSFAVFKALHERFGADSFCDLAPAIYRQRSIKSEGEIALIRQASRAVVEGMKAAAAALREGVSERQIAAEAEYASMKAGSDGTPFRAQVVSGERTLVTHPFATDRRLTRGDLVLIHIGARCRGYVSKMCRSAAVGKPAAGRRQGYAALVAAQSAAIERMKPGVPVKEIAEAAVAEMARRGYDDAFLPVIGYGVGLRQSEFYPVIATTNEYPLEANMVVDVLMPSIYRTDVGGTRITDTLLVTAAGAERLTDYPTDLIEVR